jgi:DNA-binding transcriptional MerR regulator
MRTKHPKYKTDEERGAAWLAASKRYNLKNAEKIKAYQKQWYAKKIKDMGLEYRPHKKCNALTAAAAARNAELEKRLATLEKEVKDILLDLEEVLKDNKRLANIIKWGTK